MRGPCQGGIYVNWEDGKTSLYRDWETGPKGQFRREQVSLPQGMMVSILNLKTFSIGLITNKVND